MPLELWTEKYRPKTMDEYVWRDPNMRTKVEEWLKEGGLPHVLFSGVSGTGKTSLALLLLKMLNIPHEDLLKINASRERGIDALQDKIIGFINAWTLNDSGLKYIMLDEADKLSPLVQGLLRNEMETYSNTCRFILTCNYANKIIPPLHGRLQEIKFSSLDANDFVGRAADVLEAEHVSYEPEVLLAYYEKTYPDLRKCIGMMDQGTINGVLQPLRADDESAKDYRVQIYTLIKEKRFFEARKMLIEQADPDEYPDILKEFYQKPEMFGETMEQQEEAILIIRRGLLFDGQVADREINMAATMIELSRIE